MEAMLLKNVRYVCQECGSVSPRWMGKCPDCDKWDSFVEEVSIVKTKRKSTSSAIKPLSLSELLLMKMKDSSPISRS